MPINRPEQVTEDTGAPVRGTSPEGRHGQASRATGAIASRSSTGSEGGDFPFTLPDRGAIWMRLALNASQVANLCGVTLRQVIHWADRGYLPRSPHDSGAFSGQAVDMWLLIKEARGAGISHARAAEQAARFLAAELGSQQSAPHVGVPDLTTIASRLREMERTARHLLEIVEPHMPDEPADDLPPARSNGA